MVSPKINHIGFGAQGHIQKSRIHENDGFRVLPSANRKVTSPRWNRKILRSFCPYLFYKLTNKIDSNILKIRLHLFALFLKYDCLIFASTADYRWIIHRYLRIIHEQSTDLCVLSPLNNPKRVIGKPSGNHRKMIGNIWHSLSNMVNFWKRYGQQFRRIILLHFGLRTFRFAHGRTLKP